MWETIESKFRHEYHERFRLLFVSGSNEHEVIGTCLDMVMIDDGLGMFMGQVNIAAQTIGVVHPNPLPCSLLVGPCSLEGLITSTRAGAWSTQLMGVYRNWTPLSGDEILVLNQDLDSLIADLD